MNYTCNDRQSVAAPSQRWTAMEKLSLGRICREVRLQVRVVVGESPHCRNPQRAVQPGGGG